MNSDQLNEILSLHKNLGISPAQMTNLLNSFNEKDSPSDMIEAVMSKLSNKKKKKAKKANLSELIPKETTTPETMAPPANMEGFDMKYNSLPIFDESVTGKMSIDIPDINDARITVEYLVSDDVTDFIHKHSKKPYVKISQGILAMWSIYGIICITFRDPRLIGVLIGAKMPLEFGDVCESTYRIVSHIVHPGARSIGIGTALIRRLLNISSTAQQLTTRKDIVSSIPIRRYLRPINLRVIKGAGASYISYKRQGDRSDVMDKTKYRTSYGVDFTMLTIDNKSMIKSALDFYVKNKAPYSFSPSDEDWASWISETETYVVGKNISNAHKMEALGLDVEINAVFTIQRSTLVTDHGDFGLGVLLLAVGNSDVLLKASVEACKSEIYLMIKELGQITYESLNTISANNSLVDEHLVTINLSMRGSKSSLLFPTI